MALEKSDGGGTAVFGAQRIFPLTGLDWYNEGAYGLSWLNLLRLNYTASSGDVNRL
jgi:hypothetical protein